MARDTRYDLYSQLTEREQEVYKLMVTTPLTKPQIAKYLHISTGTINTHISNILNKICVKNRYELIINHYKQPENLETKGIRTNERTISNLFMEYKWKC